MSFKSIIIMLCFIFNILLIHDLFAEDSSQLKNIDTLLSTCENFDSEEECIIADCMWDPDRGCYDLDSNDGDDNDWEDECNQYSENLCEVFDYCSWDEDSNLCVRIDDNDENDFEECSDVDNEEDCIRIPGCDWSTIATPNGVFEMCVESSGTDGDWNDDGGWDECGQLSQDECTTVEFCEWNEEQNECIRFEDEDSGGDFECSDLGYEECNYYDFCEWIEDSDNATGFGTCIDAAGPSPCSDFGQEDCEWFDECVWTDNGCQDYNWNDCDPDAICGQALTCVDGLLYPTTCGPENCDDPIGDCDDEDNNEIPECLLDCEGIENLDPAHFPDEACDLIISLFGFDPGFNSCVSDCDDEVLIAINEIVADCYECLSDATLDCFDVFFNDDENDCGEASINEDGCCDFESLIPCMDEFGNQLECDWDWDEYCPEPGIPGGYTQVEFDLIESGIVSLILTAECGENIAVIDNQYFGAGTYTFGFDVAELELLTGAYQVQLKLNQNILETAYIWVCGLLDTECSNLTYDECVDAEYCQPNLDASGQFEGCVESDNEEGCYENGEFYCIGCELFISDCDYYECTEEGWEGPFTIDECGEGDGGGCADGGGLLAYLELEDTVGMPGSEVVVPMYLNSPDPVGGVQFKLFNSPGAVPAGINSLDDCFTGNYNNLEEAYIGIIFSLEGCNYPANQEVHIADLIFEISPFVPIGVELALEFDYTIVADSGGNEVLSCGIGADIFLGMLGDVSGDGEINVLDIVAMVSFALGTDYPSDEEFWASDINNDGYVNVLDIVSIVNLILEN